MRWDNETDASRSLTDFARERILKLVQFRRDEGASDLRLPSEAELCETLGVSRTTVRRATDQLVEAGDVVRHHGRGAFAVPRSSKVSTTRAVVGLLYRPEDINEYTGKIIGALDQAARRREMTTVICSDIGEVDKWEPGRGIPTHAGSISGFISNAFPHDQLARLEARRIPTICLNNVRYLGRARYVIYEGPDNFSLPLEHLLGLGHRHLAYVGPTVTDKYLLGELKPFQLALQENHPSASLSLVRCGTEHADVPDAARRLIEEYPHVTGLLVYDDLMAGWLIGELKQLGKRVPEDISVIAFNSFTDARASLVARPQLTCMELRYTKIAELALDLFVRILQGKAPARKREVTIRQLIERESTGPAPA